MALTAQQMLLARSPVTAVAARVWLLPALPAATEALWVAGEPVTFLPQPTTITNDLADYVGASAFDVEVDDDISLYPANGMFAVTTAEFLNTAWFRYTGKASSPTRFTGVSYVRGHVDGFLPGDTLDIRVLISDDTTTVTLESFEEYGNLGQPIIHDWTATVSGVNFSNTVFLPESTFLIEEQFHEPVGNPLYGGWDSWVLMARGYATDGYAIEYDAATGLSKWNGKIASARPYVQRNTISSRTYGANQVDGGSVEVSSTLGQPMVLEKDEYWNHNGDAQGSNIRDKDPITLWISSNVPTMPEEAITLPSVPNTPQEGLLKIQEVGITPPTGAAVLQWVTFVASHDPTHTRQYALTIRALDSQYNTTWKGTGSAGWPDDPYGKHLALPDMVLGSPPDLRPTLVMTSNAQLFLERFGTPPNAHLVDWRTVPMWDEWAASINGGEPFPAIGVVLPPVQAGLMLRWLMPGLGNRGTDFVAYGNHAGDQGAIWEPNDIAHFPGAMWGTDNTPASLDPGVGLGGAGTSIRRTPVLTDTNRWTDWAIDPSPNPGDPGIVADPQYAIIDVPTFSCETSESMTAVSPAVGETLAVTNAGALDAEGHITLGAETIGYEADPDDLFTSIIITERGAYSTTPDVHSVGTTVYQYIPDRNESVNYQSISWLQIMRPALPIDPEGHTIRIEKGEVWVGDASAVPGGVNWELGWYGDAPRHTIGRPRDGDPNIWVQMAGWPNDTAANRRVARIMIRINAMTDSGRAKINEVNMWASRTLGISNGEYGLGAVARSLLEEVLDPDQIAINNAFTLLGEGVGITLIEGSIEDALKTMLEPNLLVMRYTRAGGVAIEYSPQHPGYVPVVGPDALWMDPQMLYGEQSVREKAKVGYGQVRIYIENTTTGETVEGVYPPGSGSGTPKELVISAVGQVQADPTLLAKAFYLSSASRATEITGQKLTGHIPSMETGQWCVVPDAATSDGTIIYRSMRVTNITRSSAPRVRPVVDFSEWRSYGG